METRPPSYTSNELPRPDEEISQSSDGEVMSGTALSFMPVFNCRSQDGLKTHMTFAVDWHFIHNTHTYKPIEYADHDSDSLLPQITRVWCPNASVTF